MWIFLKAEMRAETGEHVSILYTVIYHWYKAVYWLYKKVYARLGCIRVCEVDRGIMMVYEGIYYGYIRVYK